MMTQWKPKSRFQPNTPTLRVDSQQAWRQSEDAVILPIVYELAEPNGHRSQPDSAILPITWPMKLPTSRRHNTSIISLEVLNNEQDRKQKLALLKDKVESAKARVLKRGKLLGKKDSPETEANSPNANPPHSTASGAKTSPSKPRYFSTAVQLLLLSVIALIVFAWVCFR